MYATKDKDKTSKSLENYTMNLFVGFQQYHYSSATAGVVAVDAQYQKKLFLFLLHVQKIILSCLFHTQFTTQSFCWTTKKLESSLTM